MNGVTGAIRIKNTSDSTEITRLVPGLKSDDESTQLLDPDVPSAELSAILTKVRRGLEERRSADESAIPVDHASADELAAINWGHRCAYEADQSQLEDATGTDNGGEAAANRSGEGAPERRSENVTSAEPELFSEGLDWLASPNEDEPIAVASAVATPPPTLAVPVTPAKVPPSSSTPDHRSVPVIDLTQRALAGPVPQPKQSLWSRIIATIGG